MNDIVGLISFAGYADSICHLTLDHGNLVTMIDDLEIVRRRDEDGTAMGDALALAVERSRKAKARSRIIILLTDGVTNAGTITPQQAADLAHDQNVKVYCIGAGTIGVAPFPSVDPFTGRERLRPTYVEIDEVTLGSIAEKTGGKYFRATDKESLTRIYADIDQLERTEISEVRYLQYTELYTWLLIFGLGLLTAAAISNETVFRSLP